MSHAASRHWFDRALTVTPGGVNSPVRAMQSVEREYPIFIDQGDGARVTDVDGNTYVDWIQSWGALPLGHADRDIVAAIRAAAGDGTSFGAPTRAEVELAELIVSAHPAIEQVRFCSSGTEATMSALRLARAATQRDAIITFSGNYHGHSDPFLATGGSGLATLGIPASPGVPAATAELTLQARFGDVDSVESCVAAAREAGRDIAAIFVEPVAANMGVIAPPRDFLSALRTIADRIGAILVFDEVITGFRVSWGGASELFGVTPDLVCLGKIIGGGLPVGAFGGRRDLMQLVAPQGSVYQAGTLSGNPLAMRAGHAQLSALRDRDAYALLDERGAHLEQALADAIAASDSEHRACVSRVGSLVTLFHVQPEHEGSSSPAIAPRDFGDADRFDTHAFARTHAAALDGGHLLPPSQYEALFVSTTHTSEMIEQLAATIAQTLRITAHA